MKDFRELEARVSKNSKGLWGFVIELGLDEFGKRIQKTSFKKTYTKKTAKIAGNEWIENYRKDNQIYKKSELKKITFAELAELWMSEYEKSGVKISSVVHRKALVKRLNSKMGDAIASKLTNAAYLKVVDGFKARYSYNYLSGLHATFSMIAAYATNKGIMSPDVSENVNLKKPVTVADLKEEKFPAFFEKAELQKFLTLAKKYLDYRYYAVFHVLANTGMRPGEILALYWEDLNGDEIRVYKTMFSNADRSNDFELLTPKTSSSVRVIETDGVTLSVLMKWKAIQAQEKLKLGALYRDSGLVFTNMNHPGCSVNKRILSYHMDKITAKMGLEKRITPHKLRHTHASLLAESGMPLHEIQERLGHTDDKITKEIYLHVTKSKKKSNIKKYIDYLNS